MTIWITLGLIGSVFMAIGLIIYFSKSKEERRAIDKKISIAHIIPWIAN